MFCNKDNFFNAVDRENDHVLEDLIINALIGIHHKYCIGWVLEAQICKNSQTNCCFGNFVNIPTDGGFIDGSCADFEFELSKDEMIIKLIPSKEFEVQKTNLDLLYVHNSNICSIFFQKKSELRFCPKSLEIQSFSGSQLLAIEY